MAERSGHRRVPAWARTARILFSALFLAGAAFNLVLTVPNADAVFEAFLRMAWLGPYRGLIQDVFLAAPTTMAVLLVVFEVSVGLAILGPGRWARGGHLASIIFMLLLVPSLAWPYFLTNLVLVALQALLLSHDFPRSVVLGGP